MRRRLEVPDAHLRGWRHARRRVLSHVRPGRLRVKGGRAKDLGRAPACPEGRTRCCGPLDAEGGRVKLRASGEESLRRRRARLRPAPAVRRQRDCRYEVYCSPRGLLVIRLMTCVSVGWTTGKATGVK